MTTEIQYLDELKSKLKDCDSLTEKKDYLKDELDYLSDGDKRNILDQDFISNISGTEKVNQIADIFVLWFEINNIYKNDDRNEAFGIIKKLFDGKVQNHFSFQSWIQFLTDNENFLEQDQRDYLQNLLEELNDTDIDKSIGGISAFTYIPLYSPQNRSQPTKSQDQEETNNTGRAGYSSRSLPPHYYNSPRTETKEELNNTNRAVSPHPIQPRESHGTLQFGQRGALYSQENLNNNSRVISPHLQQSQASTQVHNNFIQDLLDTINQIPVDQFLQLLNFMSPFISIIAKSAEHFPKQTEELKKLKNEFDLLDKSSRNHKKLAELAIKGIKLANNNIVFCNTEIKPLWQKTAFKVRKG